MTDELRPYLVNQKAALNAVHQVEHLSDEELKQLIFNMFNKMGAPGFPPGFDTSREGLLDFIAGIAGVAFSNPVDEQQ